MPDITVSEKLISFLTFLPLFFISIAVHEFAHAFTASRLGDNTAKDLGRLTLNPIKHIDIIGTVIMPIASFASGFALIGWAKPVPINRGNFSNPLKDDAKVSFAGPLSNFILSLIFLLVLSLLINIFNFAEENTVNILWYGVFFNFFLFAFNLLPIPPLDGSHLLFDIFPNKATATILNLGFYGSIILLLFIYSPLWNYFIGFIRFSLNIMLSAAGLG